MAHKYTRNMDDQGRVILPSHIRKSLNLSAGSVVEVDMEDDNTIRIKPTAERCCICGGSIEEKPLELSKDKKICFGCAQRIAKEMVK